MASDEFDAVKAMASKAREENEALKARLDAGMTDRECYELLATDGMLVKRPLLVGDDFAIPGFREAAWAEALL